MKVIQKNGRPTNRLMIDEIKDKQKREKVIKRRRNWDKGLGREK